MQRDDDGDGDGERKILHSSFVAEYFLFLPLSLSLPLCFTMFFFSSLPLSLSAAFSISRRTERKRTFLGIETTKAAEKSLWFEKREREREGKRIHGEFLRLTRGVILLSLPLSLHRRVNIVSVKEENALLTFA